MPSKTFIDITILFEGVVVPNYIKHRNCYIVNTHLIYRTGTLSCDLVARYFFKQQKGLLFHTDVSK